MANDPNRQVQAPQPLASVWQIWASRSSTTWESMPKWLQISILRARPWLQIWTLATEVGYLTLKIQQMQNIDKS